MIWKKWSTNFLLEISKFYLNFYDNFKDNDKWQWQILRCYLIEDLKEYWQIKNDNWQMSFTAYFVDLKKGK